MGKWDRRQAALEKRLHELEARLQEIEEALDQPANRDAEDRATEREDDEVMEGMGRTAMKEVEAIKAALDRIRQGTYGVCQKCGDDIGEERLDLLPYTPFCRRCAV